MAKVNGGEPNVAKIMTRPVITIDQNSTVQEASLVLRKNNIHGLVVVDKKTRNVEGILTDKDIVSKVVAENKSPREVKVEDVMSPKLITATREDTVARIAKVMYANEVTRAPVIDGNGRLVGIVTSSDIERVLSGLAESYGLDFERRTPPIARGPHTIRGICEECEVETEDLKYVNGRWLCEEDAAQFAEGPGSGEKAPFPQQEFKGEEKKSRR